MPQTITEKILGRVMGRPVTVGETIYPEPDLMTVHDWYVVNFDNTLKELGIDRLKRADRILISTDHEPIAASPKASARQKAVREIVARHGIERFFDVGRGGHGHVFPMEKGIIRPGMFVLAYDTHVTNYGAVGCLGIPMITEITEVMACGSAWLQVPHTVRVNLHGRLRPGVTPRDVAQGLTRRLPSDLIDYAVVEYGGEGLAQFGFGGRMTLCNTPLEIGAKSALVECDAWTREWMQGRSTEPAEYLQSDVDAAFRAVFDIDLGEYEPQVAMPPRPDNVVNVSQVTGTPIDHAFIGSCANCSLEDLRDAAALLAGKKISSRVRMFVTPGTQDIASQAAQEGILQTFIDAGAVLTAPGCGPCASGTIGSLGPGETSINTGTRNDPGRLGPGDGNIYLGSPLTVAASALAGAIADPRAYI